MQPKFVSELRTRNFFFKSPTIKTVNVGGTPKQLVNNQFNSPIGLYSDDAIAEAAVANPAIIQAK
jgi:hypothetical protein